jgi:hypothetical protein
VSDIREGNKIGAVPERHERRLIVNIISEYPPEVNHFTLRQSQMESTLAGYRLSPPAERRDRLISRRPAHPGEEVHLRQIPDRAGKIIIALCAVYVLVLLGQTIQYFAR